MNSPASCVFQMMLHQHHRIALCQPYCLPVDISIKGVGQRLSEFDRIRLLGDRPSAAVSDFVQAVVVVRGAIGLAERTDADLDEVTARRGIVEANRSEL